MLIDYNRLFKYKLFTPTIIHIHNFDKIYISINKNLTLYQPIIILITDY